MGESEREGKRGRQRAGEGDDPGDICGICVGPMGADDPEGREWKGSVHLSCLESERRRVLCGFSLGTMTDGRRRRRRGS